jgi:preprotein translocase subunit SecE
MNSFVAGIRTGTSRLVSYFKEGFAELKRVRWPNRKQVMNLTVVVVVTVLIMAILIYLFDLGISKLLGLIGF